MFTLTHCPESSCTISHQSHLRNVSGHRASSLALSLHLCRMCTHTVHTHTYEHIQALWLAPLSLLTLTHTCRHKEKRLPSHFLLFLIPYMRAELNRVLDVWVVFLCPKRLTNCCCPEQKQPLHCLSICAQPYQRFNTYCFKLHQSLPLLPSHSPSSLGSFFSVSFYYFASSSFSPLTSLHIIPALVAFSSSSSPLRSSLTPFAPIY